MWLAETDWHDVCAIIHSENKGVINAFTLIRGDCETCTAMIAFGKSPYYWLFQIFLSSLLLSPLISTKWTPSCGVLGSSEHHLHPSLILYPELSTFLVCS